MEEAMNVSLRLLGASACLALTALLTQPVLADGAVSGQAGKNAGVPAVTPAIVPTTTLTVKSYSIAAGGAPGNLEGAVCPAGWKVLSGACHPFYNPRVTIINQFPNLGLNTWRCGFKNNTAAKVSVFIYTVCGI
jgi:hypothetical protein